MNLKDLGTLSRSRRLKLGLSQIQTARFCGLSRTTIHLLESGTLNDLGFGKAMHLMDVLGIYIQTGQSGAIKNNALLMVSRSASVSYKEPLTAKELSKALASGLIPKGKMAHIATLIDEVPISMIGAAVEEAALNGEMASKKIWNHLHQWAKELKSPRSIWN